MDLLSRDAAALAVSIAWCVAVIGVGELIRKLRGYGDEFTRKLVHISIGIWIIPTLFLFTKWYWAAALPALAVLGNALSHHFHVLKGIERADRADLGTIFFPASFVLCIALFFTSPVPEGANGLLPGVPGAAPAGIVTMALGDALAAIVGMRFGRHPYTLLGARKSLEGSATMLVVSAAAASVALALFQVPWGTAVAVGTALAIAATALEAAGKHGLDNLTVPVFGSALAYALVRALGAHG